MAHWVMIKRNKSQRRKLRTIYGIRKQGEKRGRKKEQIGNYGKTKQDTAGIMGFFRPQREV